MDIANGVTIRLKQILSQLKVLNIIRSYTLKINYGKVEDDLKGCLIELNTLLRKCVKKIRAKPRRAEIRNVIGVLVRKKNVKPLKNPQTGEGGALEGDSRHLCEFCGVICSNYSTWKAHTVKTHGSIEGPSGEENRPDPVAEKLVCPHSECQRIFQKLSSMRKHIRLKHSRREEYRCSKCDKVFHEKGKLNRHVLTHQEGQYQCSNCQKTFHRMDNLRRHVASHMDTVKGFQCGFCGKTFSLKFNRDAHEANVHTNTDIRCGSCGKKCKNEATLKVHQRLHENNRISCSLCCKTFTRKAQYRNHVKKKHKGVSPFQKLFDTFATVGASSTS